MYYHMLAYDIRCINYHMLAYAIKCINYHILADNNSTLVWNINIKLVKKYWKASLFL